MNLDLKKKETQKFKINKLANFISENHLYEFGLNLDEITSFESIPVIYDHYENYFDGLLVYEYNNFFIHLNIDNGNNKGSHRSRFSIAHELGHYFLPDHHQSIIDGTFPCFPYNFKPKQRNVVEDEADYFAACLLMPSTNFKEACYRKKFSLELIDDLSNKFNVSTISALLRFADCDAGTYPLMITFFKNGVLNSYTQSSDFPYRDIPFKTKIGQPPPITSVIGEYYLNNNYKFKEVQDVYVNDWFWRESDKKLNEQCFYSDYGYDISILWAD